MGTGISKKAGEKPPEFGMKITSELQTESWISG